jgi:hypothetical protein
LLAERCLRNARTKLAKAASDVKGRERLISSALAPRVATLFQEFARSG